MSDWSYRYGRPRSEVHEARYGTTEVPLRRGAGGAKAMSISSNSAIAFIALGVGVVVLGAVLLRR